MKRFAVMWVCTILTISSIAVIGDVEEGVELKGATNNQINYTPHAPISINSNADFDAAHGVVNWATGDGSPGNPWIIEGWDINGTGFGYCIFVGNTTDHYEIRFCNLHDSYDFGICLFQSRYGSIINNTIYSIHSSTHDMGMLIDDCLDITILDNRIKESIYPQNYQNSHAIYIGSSDRTTTNGNNISNYGWGIRINHNNQHSVLNNEIKDCRYGIEVSTDNVIIENNFINNATWGMFLWFCKGTVITNNIMVQTGIKIYGNSIDDWINHVIDISNTVNGKPVYYWKNINMAQVPIDAGQVILAACSNITITELNVENCTIGIDLGFSNYNTISNITTSGPHVGIRLENSNFNTIFNNSMSTNEHCGIYTSRANNNSIYNNYISFNRDGISLYRSIDNEISKNIFINNNGGVDISTFSYNNSIFNNNFYNNSIQPYDDYGNFWDNGYPSGGNYWSDYTGTDIFSGPGQNISGSDGIGDTPYTFDFAQDNYPLMEPLGTPPKPLMNISKWAPLTASQEEIITYWVNYTNDGSIIAKNVYITENYPSGVTFISSIPAPDIANNVWMLGDVAPGASGSIQITVMVDTSVPIGTWLVNNVTLTYENAFGTLYQEWDEASTLVIGPQIDLTSPDGGELWMGGSSQRIWWNMTDTDDISVLTVDLYYSTDSGASFPNLIVGGLTGFSANPCFYDWNPVDLIDSNQVRIRAVVTNTSAASDQDESSTDFEIDSTPPEPASFPHAELTGIDVTIYWGESPSPDVDRYEIWFITNGWDSTGDAYIPLTTVSAGVTEYVHANRGINNPACYAYQLRTFDAAGNEARTLLQAAKFGRTLATAQNDWWLLGSSLVQSDTAINHVIQGMGFPNNWDQAMAWESGPDPWISYVKGRPDPLNDLNYITNEMGFWLHITGNSRFCTAGFISDMAMDLNAGWNLIPYPYAERMKNTDDIEQDLIANCSSYVPGSLTIFDYTAPYGIRPAAGDTISNNEEGIWIQLSSGAVWTVLNY